MDFDKPKVYGDTFISDGLVNLRCFLAKEILSQIYSFFTYFVQAVENQKIQMLGTILELKI